MNVKSKSIFLLNLLVLSSLIAFAFYYSIISNTLENNKNWESPKAKLEKKVMGAEATLQTRIAIANNQLDLGVWHGNQSLAMKDILPYNKLKFKANFEESSHFSIFFQQNKDTIYGIRISSNPSFPSMVFSVVNNEFIIKEPFNYQIKSNKWTKVKLEKLDGNNNLIVNGDKVYSWLNDQYYFTKFQLRGSERSVVIDNIYFYENGKILKKEKFSKRIFSPIIILLILIILVLFNTILWVLKSKIKWLIPITIFGFLFAIGYLSYQYFFVQYRYSGMKKLIRVVDSEKENDLTKKYKKKSKDEYRILFIGSSQTFGAGASAESKTIVSQFQSLVNERNSDINYTCINAGVSGQKTIGLLHYYQYLRPNLNPNLVIVNMGFNDNYEDKPFKSFITSIEEIIKINKEFNIETILIPEISNPNHSDLDLIRRVKITRHLMDSIGVANQLPVIKMQPFIDEHIDDGFLFWDVVHLTDFGQKLYAEELFNRIKDLE